MTFLKRKFSLLVHAQRKEHAMNDHHGFEKTAIPHMVPLRFYAFHLTANSEDAKDLLQDTFLKAYRFWNTFEQGTNVKSWLYQIMKNSYINNYRRKIKELNNIEYDENRFCHKTVQDGLLDITSHRKKNCDEMYGDEIAHSIDSLPDTFKSVIILSDVEELTYSEIAQAVDCPVGTVRSRLHRARKVLQKQLANYAQGNGYVLRKE
jgi:RNA polymerase sigma-70 factor, ECF subfamily